MNAPSRAAEQAALAAPIADAAALQAFVGSAWDERIVPALTDYIAVPAKSPMFDAQWAEHGFIERVVADAARWVERRGVAGLKLEVVRLPGRTPVIFFDVPATKLPGSPSSGASQYLYVRLPAGVTSSAPTHANVAIADKFGSAGFTVIVTLGGASGASTVNVRRLPAPGAPTASVFP